jgi:hypothetical protein
MSIMRFICIYCNKITDSTNFSDFNSDNDDKPAAYHAWRHLTLDEEEAESKAKMLLQLC